MRFKKRFIDGIVLTGLKTLLIAGAIVPYKMGVVIGGLLGRLACYLLIRHKKKTIENLRFAFKGEMDEEEIGRTANACFENLGKSLFELLCIRWRGLKNIQKSITVEGEGYLKEALNLGKGLILITAHIGNWELLGMLLAQMGYKLSVIAAPAKNIRLGEMTNAYRSRFNIETIIRGERLSARKIIKSFRDNGMLGVLLDQDIESDGIYVDFFGKKAYTPTGITSLALRFNIPVLMIFMLREEGYRHRIIINKPEGLRRSGDTKSDILHNTAIFTGIIESFIRKYPGQWVWMHDRWRRGLMTAKDI
ncbi:MAG: lysophospholipid acyltransferase family protein [Nitrospirae bacterium]|nr:lysophospholipid acyltransferase family protein [Nitrospirota bacterium]